MSEKTRKSLYSGTLMSLTQSIEEQDGIIALRLHRTGRSYPLVLYRNPSYSQFGRDCVGQRILWARAVTKEELKTEHPRTWLIYTNSRDATKDCSTALVKEMDRQTLFVLHHMEGGRELLVQSESMEILKKPPENLEPWEIFVPSAAEEEE